MATLFWKGFLVLLVIGLCECELSCRSCRWIQGETYGGIQPVMDAVMELLNDENCEDNPDQVGSVNCSDGQLCMTSAFKVSGTGFDKNGMAMGATLSSLTRSCNTLIENSDFDPDKEGEEECGYTVESDAVFDLIQFRLEPHNATLATIDVKSGKHCVCNTDDCNVHIITSVANILQGAQFAFLLVLLSFFLK